jgi:hypothetical protein
MIDTERAELDVSNAVNIIRVYLNRMDALSTQDLPKADMIRLSRTANNIDAKIGVIRKTSHKVVTMLPRNNW